MLLASELLSGGFRLCLNLEVLTLHLRSGDFCNWDLEVDPSLEEILKPNGAPQLTAAHHLHRSSRNTIHPPFRPAVALHISVSLGGHTAIL